MKETTAFLKSTPRSQPGVEPQFSKIGSPEGDNSHGSFVACGVMGLVICVLVSGCAAAAPFASMISLPRGAYQVHDETSVRLTQENFVLVRTNVVGRSKGFSFLGFVTIKPATLTKALNRMYASAEMTPGQPQTLAHLTIEQSSSYWILFGIPKIEVSGDVVQFRPEAPNAPPVAREDRERERAAAEINRDD